MPIRSMWLNDVCSLTMAAAGHLNLEASGTVKCHEDKGLIEQALEQPGAGKVLLVDGGGSLRRSNYRYRHCRACVGK